MRETREVVPRDRASARAEINITPLIDVLMVLLIIFMILAPAAHREVDASVPRPSRERGASAILLAIAEGPSYALEGLPIQSLQELKDELQTLLRTRSDKTVFVRASGQVPYGRLVEVMDAARGAGAESIGVLTEPKDKI
jgi:biopolymer transport protein ExbD